MNEFQDIATNISYASRKSHPRKRIQQNVDVAFIELPVDGIQDNSETFNLQQSFWIEPNIMDLNFLR